MFDDNEGNPIRVNKALDDDFVVESTILFWASISRC